jgi:hypothetical protein
MINLTATVHATPVAALARQNKWHGLND